MRKFLLLIFPVLFLTACSKSASLSQSKPPNPPPLPVTNTKVPDDVLKNALNLYAQKKAQGTNLSNGPCLGTVAPDWVADIANNPRQPVDEEPQNQCADFQNGNAHHFIELDPDGKLIREY